MVEDEHLRSPGLDFRIHGEPTEEEIKEENTPLGPPEADEQPIESMARQVPPEITEVMNGG